MDKEFIGQAIAELIHAQEEALGILTHAIAMQTDATELTENLRALIKASEVSGHLSPLGKRLAQSAMASAEAESALQNPAKH